MNLNKTTYHHGNLRETLITSALEILKDGTLEDLSLRALARKAGVSQTAPYLSLIHISEPTRPY